MNLCECGCGQLVKRRFVSGHNRRGQSSWCKGLTKETNLSVKAQADKMRGRTKETDEGIRRRTELNKSKFASGELTIWNKGKTKETDIRCKASSERMLKVNPMFDKEIVEKAKIGQAEYFKNNEVYNKGKKLEELHGKEKADEIRIKIGKVTNGKTYEEIYGIEKAKDIKKKIGIKSHEYMSGKTLEERLGIEGAKIVRQHYIESRTGIEQSAETREKKRQSNIQQYMNGRKNYGVGKWKRYNFYNPNQGWLKLRSSWEFTTATYLVKKGIKFLYEHKRFILDIGTFLPDFYLIDEDKFIEVKGWKSEGFLKRWDEFKESYSNIKIELWEGNEIEKIRKELGNEDKIHQTNTV